MSAADADNPYLLDAARDAACPATPSMGLVPLLFALTAASGMPPQALQFSPAAAWPTIHSRMRGTIRAESLASVLGRAIIDLGRGQADLGDIDERLHGLVVALDVFRVID